MSWTHSICPACWNKKNPDRVFEPTRDGRGECVRCCFCRYWHMSGLYLRENPTSLRCSHGDSPDGLNDGFADSIGETES